jgi:hypothetical protein
MTPLSPQPSRLPQETVQKADALRSLYLLPKVADIRLHATIPAAKVTGVLIGMAASDPSVQRSIDAMQQCSSDPVVKECLLKIQLAAVLEAVVAAVPQK